jgi:hypothetical protein
MQALRGGFVIETSVRLRNQVNIAVFGKESFAELEYDTAGVRYQVVVMHGARACIKASGYAVVFVTVTAGGVVEKEEIGEAKIIVHDR